MDLADWGLLGDAQRSQAGIRTLPLDEWVAQLVAAAPDDGAFDMRFSSDALFAGATRLGAVQADMRLDGDSVRIKTLRLDDYEAAQIRLSGALSHDGQQAAGQLDLVLDTQDARRIVGGLAERAKPFEVDLEKPCLLYTSPSPRDATLSRMPSSA